MLRPTTVRLNDRYEFDIEEHAIYDTRWDISFPCTKKARQWEEFNNFFDVYRIFILPYKKNTNTLDLSALKELDCTPRMQVVL